jgi:hypothetical protein
VKQWRCLEHQSESVSLQFHYEVFLLPNIYAVYFICKANALQIAKVRKNRHPNIVMAANWTLMASNNDFE